jgi:hypothetical protein
MQDFDAARKKRHEEREQALGDRSFRFGGQQLKFRANAPYTVTQSVAALTEATDGSAVFDVLERAVLDLIEPGSRDAFLAAVRDEEFPVTFQDLLELANWLIEQQAERPPTQPDSSASTSETTGTTSTENSSTEQAAASRT